YSLLCADLLISTSLFFFFTAPPTTAIYTLSLHDALPIWTSKGLLVIGLSGNIIIQMDPSLFIYRVAAIRAASIWRDVRNFESKEDRKSTRLNSSHVKISYAVFCLKKKKKKTKIDYEVIKT